MNAILIPDLHHAYRCGHLTPLAAMQALLERIEQAAQHNVWIARLSRERVLHYAAALAGRSVEELPLYGVPFAIKDNIDLADLPTTAGCPEYSYVPTQSAPVVQRLIDAGAIPIGKTNMDQFATGLNGTRSPYGACRNSLRGEFIAGGSSSGSAVAVAMGLVSFSLGTDTAGSGRVPAAFNNIVGLKPSCGLLSTRGAVPACRSLDCVSIFALTAEDAQQVLNVARSFDAADAYSRPHRLAPAASGGSRIGVPRADQLQFCGDSEYADCFAAACRQAQALGWSLREIDFAPFLAAARLLYEGPWLAERYAALADFLEGHAAALHPVTRQIISSGRAPSAADAFRAQYRLKELQRTCEAVWRDIDALMTPTAATIYRIEQMLADPVQLNSNLGYYTNYVNLLDLAAVAVPAGFRADGLPFGVTLSAPAGSDLRLLQMAGRLQRACVQTLGAIEQPVPAPPATVAPIPDGYISVVVCGAHMSGLPLNHQLRDRDALFIRATHTAASYKLYALPGGPPQRPGLVRVTDAGAAIDVEVWAVPAQHFGSFVAGIPSPLGIGKVELDDGSWHCGFLCEPWALAAAADITKLRSWRSYLSQAPVLPAGKA